jgi:hypothetical protein
LHPGSGIETPCALRTVGDAPSAGRARTWVLALGATLGLALACATAAWKPPAARDRQDDPAALRPGFGNTELHAWYPLTPAEAAALARREDARKGDARALLALGVLASGDARDAAAYARIGERVDRFVAEVRPTIAAAPDDWHRGYELHRAMHATFFGSERDELSRYDLGQARLTGVFEGGNYNCLSSAMLFVVLARAFDLPVRAAFVPTHVFVELGAPGGKLIEIETTSPTGFDWVHDARFYAEQGAAWSGRRGLRAVTLDEYEHRRVVEPYQLMAGAMRNAHAGESETDRGRLDELAAVVDPGDAELRRVRLQIYVNEGVRLYEAKAWRTMAKLFDVVRPAIGELAIASASDGKALSLASWATWYHAYALTIVGRREEGLALVTEGLARLDASWEDAEKLRTNYLSVINDRLCELIDAKDYATGADVFARFRRACGADRTCASNAGTIYLNWSITHENAGDWRSCRQVLQRCTAELPAESRCRDALTDLESRHRF